MVKKLSFKSYWASVEPRLTDSSSEELRDVLRVVLGGVPPTERETLLEVLAPARATADRARRVSREDTLLADIQDLVKRFAEKRDQADPWAERYVWPVEEPEPYAEFLPRLTALWKRAQTVALHGSQEVARKALRQLFHLLEQEDDYGRKLPAQALHPVDLPEAVARYLRAVYLTTPEERPEVLLEEMRRTRAWLPDTRPRVVDWLESSPDPLPEFETFLHEWVELLQQQQDADADAWLREATRLSQGISGLRALAFGAPARHAKAFLELLSLLERESPPQQVLDTAREALEALPRGHALRATVAASLARAAERLGQPELLLTARWESFAACPELSRLLDLRDAAGPQSERERWLRKAARHVRHWLDAPPSSRSRTSSAWPREEREEPSPRVDRILLTHAWLLGNEWELAWQQVPKGRQRGRPPADSPKGLVLCFLLVVLTGAQDATEVPHNVATVWRQQLRSHLPVPPEEPPSREVLALLERMERAYAELLPSLHLEEATQAGLLQWCVKEVEERAHDIVRHKQRALYEKAALMLAAGAEVLRLRGDLARANTLLNRFRMAYRRHFSFQRLLEQAAYRRV